MSGVRIELEFDHLQVTQALSAGAAVLGAPEKVLADLIDPLLRIHRARFKAKTSPDGVPWKALSPRYLRSKERNQDKILVASGQLSNDLRGQVDGDTLLFGTDRPYGAIHQFGGTIQRAASRGTLRLRTDAKGALLRQADHANLAVFARSSGTSAHKRYVERSYEVAAHEITMPARPWLGTSATDDGTLLQRVMTLITTAMGI
ncbi:phage virion morphogenesis protein [Pseudomonas citronellolis]|uniref:phage virion morphogenesis protein n=1 Tax=Pseudomonas citronellolis TaxID=53408 RepID=UPI0023E46B78|nr:phage virion morphogenesis protein [Pseudomonas citronellolis]MDF3932943.1 phage virion morphogenesis protein [Pseudomonas citronellolis]